MRWNEACTVATVLKCTTGCSVGRVSIVITMRELRFDSLQRQGFFSTLFRPAFGSAQRYMQWVPGCFDGCKVADV